MSEIYFIGISYESKSKVYYLENTSSTDTFSLARNAQKKGRNFLLQVGFSVLDTPPLDIISYEEKIEQITNELNKGKIKESELVDLLVNEFNGKTKYLPKT
ncbi:MAG: hypothetical protein AABW50_02080, partial [Nanoarchaeota archaeon]